ncbi:hypothetical protein [Tissierella praeacuta]|uniref:hypothetical protein n=1 Tax=Tissierella praeacuta TaxID=43131 RepID=UPI0028ACED20|nr:hypothetical protein [Tissierella praeacuta]
MLSNRIQFEGYIKSYLNNYLERKKNKEDFKIGFYEYLLNQIFNVAGRTILALLYTFKKDNLLQGNTSEERNTKMIFVLLISLMVNSSCQIKEKSEIPKEYLQIIGTKYNNKMNEKDGVSAILYEYDVDEKKVISFEELGEVALYPVGYKDYKNNKVYYSGSNNGLYDNLYEYDLNTKNKKQLTEGKFVFNDMYIIGDEIFVTAAAEGKTVTQPGKFDFITNNLIYLDAEDDDTWFHSFSFNYSSKKFLCLTTSDKVMRSKRVTQETFIRPKRIFLMDKDFKNIEHIYETEDFEIRLTRQLDDSTILMVTTPMMGSKERRQIKILDIDSGEIKDLEIEGVREVYSFYPRDNKEGIFILGLSRNFSNEIFYYNLKTKELTNIFQDYEFLEGHKTLVDFTYGLNK